MIGKSDLFILVVSASLLAVGIYRWQHNMSQININAQQAKTQQIAPVQVAPTSNPTVISAISSSNNMTSQTTVSAVTSVQTSVPVSVNESSPIRNIVVSSTVSEPISSTPTSSTPDNNRLLLGSYKVVSGDYLSKIAQQYGTTVETLQELNNLNGTLLAIGQELLYPLPAN